MNDDVEFDYADDERVDDVGCVGPTFHNPRAYGAI